MANMWTAKCPNFVCHPCNNSRRAIEFQFRKKPAELQQWFAEFKRERPDEWKAKVRACSLSVGGLGETATNADRGRKISQFLSGVEQFFTVKEECEVVWLRRNQFLAHMQSVEGLDEEQAVQQWADSLESLGVKKCGSGGADREVAVALPRKTVMCRGKTARASLSMV